MRKPAWVRRRDRGRYVRSLAERFVSKDTPSYTALVRHADHLRGRRGD